ncbi:YhcN/YlaJ family sporulation lipoprotein [Cohnella hashimotonis]|uniref:YhcN/YlaJ family sporulation lipoprotein n=1 Tax=Cohnella hashimotonis TaxID=2826895 RepID=A0ABT6TCK5_9BACL|nr:YhcN/YlaJ family sporulation lipoprotein [Cohnella hashimotonis]MDI4644563.1 YhcN/YlaJ family sporulation lipoprotein [Cohnella hashimotonis]
MWQRAMAAALVLTTSLTMAGCASKQGDVGNSNIKPQSINDRFSDDGRNEMNRMHGTQRMNNNVVGLHGNSHLEMDQKIADKLAARSDVQSAYVVRSDRNAYVAIMSEGHGDHELSSTLKGEIADEVKTMSPATDHVYVSSNPEWGDRMRGYAEQVRQGHPIQGLLTEFNAIVNRIFPTAEDGHRNAGYEGTAGNAGDNGLHGNGAYSGGIHGSSLQGNGTHSGGVHGSGVTGGANGGPAFGTNARHPHMNNVSRP